MRRAFRFAYRARRRRITLATAVTVLGLAVSVPTLSWAHAVVFPRQSTTGAYEKYVLRVPNEKAVPTTRVELVFPKDVRVTSFADVPGWQLEVVTDSAKAITAAIWTGRLPPERFVEFPFVAVNERSRDRQWAMAPATRDGERPTLTLTTPQRAGKTSSQRKSDAPVARRPGHHFR